ncbi:hypothetical protein BJX70DRAFT_395122 [Aspergillus crustosus]
MPPLPHPGQWVLIDVGSRKQPGKYDGEEFPTKVYLKSAACFAPASGRRGPLYLVAGQASPTETVFADNITIVDESPSESVQLNTGTSMGDSHNVEGRFTSNESTNANTVRPLPYETNLEEKEEWETDSQEF